VISRFCDSNQWATVPTPQLFIDLAVHSAHHCNYLQIDSAPTAEHNPSLVLGTLTPSPLPAT